MNKYIKYYKHFKPQIKDFRKFIIINKNRKINYLKAIDLKQNNKSDFVDEIIKNYEYSVDNFNNLKIKFNLDEVKAMKKLSYRMKKYLDTLDLSKF